MKRVLVTGAGGFIGSHLVEHLVAEGVDVRAMVHYNSRNSHGHLELLSADARASFEVVAGDVRDPFFIRSAVKGVDTVFHLAALIGIPYSYLAPLSYVHTNIEGTLHMLQAARNVGVECFVHTSTSETYGSAHVVPINEDHPLQGQSPYAATKIGADKLVEAFNRSFGLPAVTVRPFNTFGPRQSARAVIPTIITQCLAGKRLRLGNLRPTRDLNFVSNTVDGFILAAIAPAAVGETINIGSGREISIGDLAQNIAELLGVSADIESEEQRRRPELSEVDRLLAGIGRAEKLLGYAPRVSLEEGLTRTIEWFKEHSERYRTDVYVV